MPTSKFNLASILSSSDFTIEAWTYALSSSAGKWKTIIAQSGVGIQDLYFVNNSYGDTDKPGVSIIDAATGTNYYIVSNTTLTLNTWNHIAAVRYNTSLMLFLNGTLVGSITIPYGMKINTTNNEGNVTIGRLNSADSTLFNGYIDELRVSNIARYTSNFTPSTSEFNIDANTVFLSHFDKQLKTGLEDESGKLWSVSSGTVINTVAAKFGSSGVQLNGSSQYITTSSIIPNSGDFTVEFFSYVTNATQYPALFSTRTNGNNGILLGVTGTDNRISFSAGNGSWLFQPTSTLTFTRNSWHHFAVCRCGSNFYVFCDGILYCSGNSSSNITNQTFCLGSDLGNQVAGVYLNGYIDELRVSNVARYTSNFVPPTQAFENIIINSNFYYCYIV